MLERFINQLVTVDTPTGSVIGVLVRNDHSLHNGIGCFAITTQQKLLDTRQKLGFNQKEGEG
jgi:hypothetical protein